MRLARLRRRAPIGSTPRCCRPSSRRSPSSSTCWPRPRDPDAFDTVSREAVLRVLEVACESYDWVVLDMPRHRRAWTLEVLPGCDEVLVISELTVPALIAARSLSDEIEAGAGPGPQAADRAEPPGQPHVRPGALDGRGREGAAAQGRSRHQLRLGGRRRLGQPGRADRPAPAEVEDRQGRRRAWSNASPTAPARRDAPASQERPPDGSFQSLPRPGGQAARPIEPPAAAPAPAPVACGGRGPEAAARPKHAEPKATAPPVQHLDMHSRLHARLIDELDLCQAGQAGRSASCAAR